MQIELNFQEIKAGAVYLVAELCPLLRCSKSHAYALIKGKKIKSFFVGKKDHSGIRIRGQAILDFIQSREEVA